MMTEDSFYFNLNIPERKHTLWLFQFLRLEYMFLSEIFSF